MSILISNLLSTLAVETGDIIFFGADKSKVVNEAMGALRIKVAQELNLVASGWAPVWVGTRGRCPPGIEQPDGDSDDTTAAFHL